MVGAIDPVGAASAGAAVLPPVRPPPQNDAGPAAPGAAEGPRDTVSLSPIAAAQLGSPTSSAAAGAAGQDDGGGPGDLTEEERRVVAQLRARDQEVRAHEQAHARVGGQYAGAPTYEFETGPDGRRYAVGGEVSIDASPVDGDPEATIDKLEQVRAAALAPAEPSAQDRRVAAQAQADIAQARGELATQRREEAQGEGDAPAPAGPSAGAGDAPSTAAGRPQPPQGGASPPLFGPDARAEAPASLLASPSSDAPRGFAPASQDPSQDPTVRAALAAYARAAALA